jgi:type II secretory pathway component PulF
MNRYRVTLENYDGRCKRVTVIALSASDAMAACQRNGWIPVDVQEVA